VDFSFSDEQLLLKKTVSDFATKEIEPHIDEWEEQEQIPKELYKKMGELGFLGLGYPEEFGGMNSDTVTYAIFGEQLGYSSVSVASSTLAHMGLGLSALNAMGTAEQKKKYLEPGIKGEKIAAFGLTEPNAGSDAGSIQTVAVKDGTSYVINGTKTFITNGASCDFVTLAVKTDKTKGAKGISLLLVEKGTPGFQVNRKLRKLGGNMSDTCELIFEDCRVDQANLIGPENTGFLGAMKTLHLGRLIISACVVGMAQRALDLAKEYAIQRTQFGTAIKNFQVIQHMLADMATQIEMHRSFVYKVAWMNDQGLKCNKEASMVKLATTRMVKQVVDDALQIHGGYGYMEEYPISRMYKEARLFEIVEGTSQIQRNIIAKELGL